MNLAAMKRACRLSHKNDRYDCRYRNLEEELEKIYSAHPDFILISGGAKGVDSIAEVWAKSRNLPIEESDIILFR